MRDAAPRRRFAFLLDAWRLAWPYFMGTDRLRGRLLLAAVVALNLVGVAISVWFNAWNNDFYNALQNLDEGEFWRQLGIFCVIAVSAIVAGVYEYYLTQVLEIRWRTWLTDQLLDRWLANRTYWQLSLDLGQPDNPDQRVAEDCRLYVNLTLLLSIGIMNAVVSFLSFVAILWAISGPLTLLGITIPGYMVWAAVLYAFLGTLVAHLIGRPLIRLNFEQQRREADFRFSLVRFRENVEAIALLAGEAVERRLLDGRFKTLIANFLAIANKRKQLVGYSVTYRQLAIIFPFVVAAPRFFAKEIQLGGLMQIANAFGEVQRALSYLINVYPEIAQWRSVVERLAGFQARMAAAEAVRQEVAVDGAVLEVRGATLVLPDGRTLVQDFDLWVEPGEAVLLTGPSGTGKTTFFRALSGLWPVARGRIRLPAASVMFLPQKPYLPTGTLAQVLSYPDAPPAERARLVALLHMIGLGHLEAQLEREDNWSLKLSLGEQQRIGFARALLKRPKWLFLDEATSALDEAAERSLHELVKQELAGVTLVSIGHRSSLAAMHDRQVAIAEPSAG